MNGLSALFFGLAALLALWLAFVWRGLRRPWMPAELANAVIAFNETEFRADHPFRVVGRVDTVYQLSDGLHVPTDLKNRDHFRVYDTDVAQLSLYGWLLRENGHRTAPYGFLIVNNRQTGRRRALRVELRGDDYAHALVARYEDLLDGAVPRKSAGGKCKTCGHRGLRC